MGSKLSLSGPPVDASSLFRALCFALVAGLDCVAISAISRLLLAVGESRLGRADNGAIGSPIARLAYNVRQDDEHCQLSAQVQFQFSGLSRLSRAYHRRCDSVCPKSADSSKVRRRC